MKPMEAKSTHPLLSGTALGDNKTSPCQGQWYLCMSSVSPGSSSTTIGAFMLMPVYHFDYWKLNHQPFLELVFHAQSLTENNDDGDDDRDSQDVEAPVAQRSKKKKQKVPAVQEI